jgi:hypothetical protein
MGAAAGVEALLSKRTGEAGDGDATAILAMGVWLLSLLRGGKVDCSARGNWKGEPVELDSVAVVVTSKGPDVCCKEELGKRAGDELDASGLTRSGGELDDLQANTASVHLFSTLARSHLSGSCCVDVQPFRAVSRTSPTTVRLISLSFVELLLVGNRRHGANGCLKPLVRRTGALTRPAHAQPPEVVLSNSALIWAADSAAAAAWAYRVLLELPAILLRAG